MVAFAGFEMPLQYPSGVLKEHLHTRAAAGLFDVSHMGQIIVRPRSGTVADAAKALERLVPANVAGLAPGRQRYTFFTNDHGGILDDFMISNLDDHLLLVVNATRKSVDEAHLRACMSDLCEIELKQDTALVALQGPQAESVLVKIAPETAQMHFMDVRRLKIMGVDCVVSRSGYTGEDGFEISMPAVIAREVVEGLLENKSVAPIGLGARDSLRLEAGLCLYGAELDETTTPVEAGLAWAIAPSRREGGSREGAFPGADIILRQLMEGTSRRRAGLRPRSRTPLRAGTQIFANEDSNSPIGAVTSGGFAPSLNAPAAMGFVPALETKPDTRLFAQVRGKRLPVCVTELPFIELHYKYR